MGERRMEPVGSLDEGLLRAIRAVKTAEIAYEDFMVDHGDIVKEEQRLRRVMIDRSHDVERLEDAVRRAGYVVIDEKSLAERYEVGGPE